MVIFEGKMIRTILRDISPGKGIVATLLLASIGFLTFMFLGVIVVAALSGSWDVESVTASGHEGPLGLNAIRILQMFQTTGLFIFPSLVVAFLASSSMSQFLGLKAVPLRMLLLSVLMMVVFIPGINLIASLNAMLPMPEWMDRMEESAGKLIKSLLVTDSPRVFYFNLMVVAVLPAIGEELLFRGVLQKYFCKLTGNVLWGVVVTSLIFSAIHLQFHGFVPRFLLGMVFGYLYVWTGSILTPILVHFANNGLAVYAYYLIGKGSIPMETETIGNVSDYWQLGLFSLGLSSILLCAIWRGRVTSQGQPSPAQASEGP